MAVGKRDGDDAKMVLPGLGTFGAGDVKSSIAKFIPAGMNDEVPNSGTFELADKPNLGYMDRETTAGKTSGSTSKMSLGGIGTFQVGQEKEQGTGLLDFSKALSSALISLLKGFVAVFPFLELPALKSEDKPDPNTAIDPSLAEVYYPTPKSYVEEAEKQLELNPPPPKTPFSKIEEDRVNDATDSPHYENPFDRLITRAGFPSKARVHAAKTHTEASGRVPLTQLGLSEKEVYALCAKFAPVAAKTTVLAIASGISCLMFQHCYAAKVEPQFLEKCRGYNQDCAQFQAKARPLGAIANAFSSGVGLTYYNWDVNGIPYYAVNEEGSIGNGHNGKVDFGTWGGGYSDNVGVRDYFSQTQEYGANWYEGTYGYKTGWSIPVVQSVGVEGGGGTQVNVPLKEGEIGKPIYATNGYHVGPYFGYADRVGVDWYNGGVSFNRGVASPFVGIGVNSGTSIGFPSVGTIMNRMGIRDMDQLSQMVAAAGTRTQQSSAIGG
ncbi:unnamed protein product [Heligmosomoides polygyrus]|uniref:Uncharacterized protein n=1 Tax=Heligmosomoides polygyrus TaxID=6339 RepID=A0A3P8F0Y7_HELPZ|nr:unnamed protein product [Heligmosomoides polygyrus]